MSGPINRKPSKKTHKKCIKCRNWLERTVFFGVHESSSDGRQSICKTCKGAANKQARNTNMTQYLRHHIATRCLTQLGDLAPAGFTKDLTKHLGYSIRELIAHLRTDLQAREGEDRKLRVALVDDDYHVDHIFPLSKFPVIIPDPDGNNEIGEIIDWEVFRKCWAIENLSAIPASENLAKGAKVDE